MQLHILPCMAAGISIQGVNTGVAWNAPAGYYYSAAPILQDTTVSVSSDDVQRRPCTRTWACKAKLASDPSCIHARCTHAWKLGSRLPGRPTTTTGPVGRQASCLSVAAGATCPLHSSPLPAAIWPLDLSLSMRMLLHLHASNKEASRRIGSS